MPRYNPPLDRFRTSLSFGLLCIFLAILFVAGGASRADVTGQAIVRGAASLALAVLAMVGDRRALVQIWPVFLILTAAILLPLIQLVPLPIGIWQTLPGRGLLSESVRLGGEGSSWRPVSMVPGATLNALLSLLIPLATLGLVGGLDQRENARLPVAMLVLVGLSTLLGLLQATRAGINNPFINAGINEISGPFANRNHFALLLAIGCSTAPVWALQGSRNWGGRLAIGAGLVLLFVLAIFATGSRAGLLVGAVGILLGMVMAWLRSRRALRRRARWIAPVAGAGVLTVALAVVALSIMAGRATSVDRLLGQQVEQDLRARALPTVLSMVREYFPVGSGLGGFDPVFRIHEPLALLSPLYFNHAHNDFLEVVLDAGIAGLAVMIIAIGWWSWKSLQAWRRGPDGMLAQLGSTVLALVMIASVFDYPARTPLIMAIIIIAAVWLNGGRHMREGSALPDQEQRL